MKVQFTHSLNEYTHLVMFDLASKITGVCIWDIQKATPVKTRIINTNKGEAEIPTVNLYFSLESLFKELETEGIDLSKILIYKEAMPVQLRGGSSTVQTFVALAKAHAVLDTFCYLKNLAIYDYSGIFPITTHSYLKKIGGFDSSKKIEKEDIRQYVEAKYSLKNLTFDEADSIFLAQTFVENVWNRDIHNQIKEIKRHKKELKMDKSKKECDLEIERLTNLLL